MRVPAILLTLSLLIAGAALAGLLYRDLAPVALLAALAALILLGRAWRGSPARRRVRPGRVRAADRPRNRVVVDGSNLLYWRDGEPDLATVATVVQALTAEGRSPVIWFDANVGYLVGDRYWGAERLAKGMGIDPRQVFVAPKGTPADPLILDAATRLRAPIVTNDRYRDWAEEFPILRQPDRLIRGGIENGRAVLRPGTPARQGTAHRAA